MGAHRLAWELAHGDPGTQHVLHRCDNPSCVNVDHLFLGDHKVNMRDMARKERAVGHLGEINGNARLSSDDVAAIRRLVAYGNTQQWVADRYGIKQGQVSKIVNRHAWRIS